MVTQAQRRELPSTVWERLTLGGYVDLTVDVSPAMPNRALQLTANLLRGSPQLSLVVIWHEHSLSKRKLEISLYEYR